MYNVGHYLEFYEHARQWLALLFMCFNHPLFVDCCTD